MLILAVSTATPAISTALWQDGRLLAEIKLVGGRPHAETLLPLVQEILDRTGRLVAAIDVYACTVGPGSYTGIRIGVSTIKAMAYAMNKPVLGISTLQAMAWPYAACRGLIACPVLDARGLRIFGSAWRGGSNLLPDAGWPAQDFLDRLRQIRAMQPEPASEEMLLIGRLPPATQAVFAAATGDGMRFAPVSAGEPSAACVAELAEQMALLGSGSPAQDLMPAYLSLSQAERRLEQKPCPGL